jgi:hypothetical protein
MALLFRISSLLLYDAHMELLHSYTSTQSHWSSGSTVCFPLGGAAVRIPGMHPHLQWNQVLLLAMSRYIDPNVIPDHWLQLVLFASDFATTLASGCLSHAFPGSIPLLAGCTLPRNSVKLLLGRSLVEALHLHSNTVSMVQWVNRFCFPPGDAPVSNV